MGFTKLDEGIVRSSVWSEAYPTRILWVTMLAMCDSKGFVASSRSGLVREANITEQEFEIGIAILEAPDKDSRSPEFEGRRVEKCDGGWRVLNYPKYRNYSYSSSPEAVRQRKHRSKSKERDGSLHVTKGCDISASASSSSEDKKKGVPAAVVTEIITYLNEKTGKRFSLKSSDTVKHIGGRLSEGRTVEDFKRVIDTKVAKWHGTTWTDNRPGREGQTVHGDDFLCPSTLFCAKNFETYLNETPAASKMTAEEWRAQQDAELKKLRGQ